MPNLDLLHMLGDAPEGPWGMFAVPQGDGTDMISVIVPRSLWTLMTRSHPFTSEVALMEGAGRCAIQRALAEHRLKSPLWVMAEDAGVEVPVESDWFPVLRRCGRCGKPVPPGEVLEGLSNAVPPDSRGEIQLKVLCPDCNVQTDHRLTPWGIPQG